VWSVPIETEPSKYDLVVLRLLALLKPHPSQPEGVREHYPIRPPQRPEALRGQNMVACQCPGLPSLSWAATRRTQPRRVAIRLRTELIMSDLQTSMGDVILQMIVGLPGRDGKEAVEQLKAIY
jgi:hypothetical protein